MIRKRIIPTLLIDNGNLIKTVRFCSPKYIGDPINAVRIFNEKGVDELNLIDKNAFKMGINFNLLENISNEAFMPLSYGGGIKSVDEVEKILRIGFEKVILGSLFFTHPQIIYKLIERFGSQAIVIALDYKYSKNDFYCFFQNGTINSRLILKNSIDLCNKLGVGEIILTNIDKEGTMEGLDCDTYKLFRSNSNCQVVINGGAKDFTEVFNLLNSNSVDAVSASSIFIYYGKKKAILINYPGEAFFERGI